MYIDDSFDRISRSIHPIEIYNRVNLITVGDITFLAVHRQLCKVHSTNA